MEKLQNISLDKLNLKITVRDWLDNKFPEFGIDIPKVLSNGSAVDRGINDKFDDYYFVPKSTNQNGIAAKVKFLVSFDSSGSNRIIDWHLSFGDGQSVQGKAPENAILTEELHEFWSSTKEYFPGDFVIYQNEFYSLAVYRCVEQNTGSIPTDFSGDWVVESMFSATEIKAKLAKGFDFNKISSKGILLINNEYIKYSGVTHNFQNALNEWTFVKTYDQINFGVTKLKKELLSTVPEEFKTDSVKLEVEDISTFPDPANGVPFTLLINNEAFWATQVEVESGENSPLASGSGSVTTAKTHLINSKIEIDDEVIVVNSTAGFPASGTILIDDEQIKYTEKTSTSFEGLIRGANDTEAAEHSLTDNENNPTVIENLTIKNFVLAANSPNEFNVGDIIKDINNFYFEEETRISNIDEYVYDDGYIQQSNSRTVTGIDTDFDSDLVGATLKYSDGTTAKIESVASPTQLRVNKSKTIGKYSPLSVSSSGKNYTYRLASNHDLEVGDTVTVSGAQWKNIDGLQVTTLSGTTNPESDDYKKVTLSVNKNKNFAQYLTKGVKYDIYASNIPEKSNATFTITKDVPTDPKVKTLEVTLSTASFLPAGKVGPKKAFIKKNGTCNYNVQNAKISSVTSTTFTINNQSATSKDPVDIKTAGVITAARPYTIAVKEITIDQPALNAGQATFITPDEDRHVIFAKRAQFSTTEGDHKIGDYVRQLTVYNKKPYLCLISHTLSTLEEDFLETLVGENTPDKRPDYWQLIPDNELIIKFKNIDRGKYATELENHKIDSTIQGVTIVNHYYKYDSGVNFGSVKNGAASVLLTGIDNHNRKFQYNTVVYPKENLLALNGLGYVTEPDFPSPYAFLTDAVGITDQIYSFSIFKTSSNNVNRYDFVNDEITIDN